jgi:hypothetical protein
MEGSRRTRATAFDPTYGSTLGQFFLSSDSVIPSFTTWGFAAAHPELFTAEENEAFNTIGCRVAARRAAGACRGAWGSLLCAASGESSQ